MFDLDKKISEIHFSLDIYSKEKTSLDAKIMADEIELDVLSKVRTYFISFSEFARDRVKNKIESIVNKALSSVINDQKLVFKIIPNRQKKNVVYDLYLQTEDKLSPLEDANGGGTLDIITMALRIAFLKFFEGQLRQTMILDEPFKNLSAKYIPRAVEWLKLVSEQFGIQFIIVTHIIELVECADKTFKVIKKNGKSTTTPAENL